MGRFLYALMLVLYVAAGAAATTAAWSLHPAAGWSLLALVLLSAAGTLQNRRRVTTTIHVEPVPGVVPMSARAEAQRLRVYDGVERAAATWMGRNAAGDPPGTLR